MVIAKHKRSTELSRKKHCFDALHAWPYATCPKLYPSLMSTAHAHSYAHLLLMTSFSSKHFSRIIALDTCFDNKVNF